MTSDKFASHKKHDIEPLEVRVNRLKNIVKHFNKAYEIIEISDSNGSADKDPLLEAIVVSEETEESAVNINKIRVEKGLKPLDIIVIEWILADDGVPISSTRIRKGEIDNKGKLQLATVPSLYSISK